ncbi:MAG: hypothetical protein QNJ13_08700 [Paracoccaceae bacterium]|nr:hypothetical protein [Paracoccaceae bacterium]
MKTTLAYARLGLVSLAAAVAPITGAAQELCGTDLFEGEPDAAVLMDRTIEYLDILKENGVVAFQGDEGRMSVDAARKALEDGVGSASLLACVVNSNSIEFAGEAGSQIIGCDPISGPMFFQSGGTSPGPTTGKLFCTQEVVTMAQYLGSEA